MEEEKREENVVVNNSIPGALNVVPPVIPPAVDEGISIPPATNDGPAIPPTRDDGPAIPPTRNDEVTIPQAPKEEQGVKVEKPVQQVSPVKEETPKKEEKEKIQYNKFNKILIYVFIVILVMAVLLCLLQFSNPDFSKFMWGINNKVSDLLFGMMQNMTFVSKYGLIVVEVLLFASIIVEGILSLIYKKDLKTKTKIANIMAPIVVVCGLLVSINTYFTFSNASHRGINEIYMRANMGSSYTQENLEDVIDYFKNRIIIYSESLNRVNGEIDTGSKPYDLAVEDLKNLAIKYEFLKGSYPKNIYTLSESDLKRFDYPVGLTYNFTIGIDDVNLSNLNKIFTITHELCHMKGVFRESDANYCSFLAGYNSNSDVSKYAMYINIMPNLLEALKNEELFDNIENEFGNICIESGYSEICNMYFKDINRYVKDTDTLELYTYSLDVYKSKKEELKQYLLGLNNRFNVTIQDNENKQLSLEEANKLIDEEDPNGLYIVGKITKEKYNENQKYLKTISDYFPHLYLSNSKDKEPDYSNYDYLKPNPVGNFITFTESEPEFGYDRSVRSILEYYDKYVLN